MEHSWPLRSVFFEEHIGPDEDIGVLNELAGKLEKMTSGERLKYKAVLEFDGWKSVERSLWLADRLDEYMFDPSQVSYGDYGRECLMVPLLDAYRQKRLCPQFCFRQLLAVIDLLPAFF